MPNDYFYSGDKSGGVTNDPFAAYQEAAKVMLQRKGPVVGVHLEMRR